MPEHPVSCFEDIIRCPCARHAPLRAVKDGDRTLHCSHDGCPFGTGSGFPVVRGQPVLVDFSRSILRRDALLRSDGESTIKRKGGLLRGLRHRISNRYNSVAGRCCEVLLARAKALTENPTILVVGGGTIGSGSEKLYGDRDVRLLSFDIYASENTNLIADAHSIPLADNSVDGVWIEAVLEHVLSPETVVQEIHRVLKPGGTVYADTPFMQQVHEGPYDFTRYTESGHRWLFRRFDMIDSGPVAGPAVTLQWAIGYFVSGLFRSRKAGTIARVLFFWLAFLDRAIPTRYAIDGASSVFFLGKKGDAVLTEEQILCHYQGAQ